MSGNADPKPAPASVPPPRVIPGLSLPASSQQPPASAPKPRKRSSKAKVPLARSVGDGGSGAQSPAVVPVPEVAADGGDEELVVEAKKTSAVEAVQKRLRATTKKIQRIEGYEASPATLNADQKRAVEGKPVLEAIVRELNDLLSVLKAEEAEDEARDKRNAAVEEKKQARAIEAAVKQAKADAQQHVVLLFQFLHLHSLYSSQNGFAPTPLPPIVNEATGQEVAAVRMLYDAFSNGPLLGGDDAVERFTKLAQSSTDEALPGVTYARVQQLVHGLTTPPSDAAGASSGAELKLPSDEPAGAADSVIALVDGVTEDVHPPPPPQPSFLQPSEVDQPPAVETPPADEKVQHWAEDIALEPQAPPSGPATPAADVSLDTPTLSIPPTPTAVAPPETAFAQQQQQQQLDATAPIDWAADDEAGGLPHLPELAPPVPVVAAQQQQQQSTPSTASDGFQPARPPRHGSGKGSHRGGGEGRPHRGGGGGEGRGRGRGSYRGGGGNKGGANPANGEAREPREPREPRPPRAERTDSNGEGGRGRGGRGGGRGGRGGRGRGASANGQPQSNAGSAPPTPAA